MKFDMTPDQRTAWEGRTHEILFTIQDETSILQLRTTDDEAIKRATYVKTS